MTFKRMKLVTNHKTNKQKIEFRVYSADDTFKTIAPRAWLHLNIENRTSKNDLNECNAFMVREFTKNHFNKALDLNVKLHKASPEDRESVMDAFIKENGIKQF